MRLRFAIPLCLAIAAAHLSCSSNRLPAADLDEGQRAAVPVPKPDFTLSPEHPRLWAAAGTDLAAKVAADRSNVWRLVVAAADAAPPKPAPAQIAERMACAAAIFRFGALPGPKVTGAKYKKSRADYGAQAVSDLAAFDLSAKNYKALAQHFVYLCVTYDWCYSLLSADQKTAFVNGIEAWLAAIKNGGKTIPATVPGYEAWWGYNIMPGAAMLAALAIHGDSQADWVSDLYHVWWDVLPSTNAAPHYNFAYHKQVLPLGGNREGLGYWVEPDLTGVEPVEFAKSAFAAATNDHSADDLNPHNYPAWLLFQTDPNISQGQFLRCLTTTLYSPMVDPRLSTALWSYKLGMETGHPDPNRAALARWLLDQTKGFGFRSPSTAALYPFLSYLVIGDPRVAGKSPADQKLPLVYSTTREVFQRSDWTPQATVLYFGSGDYKTRSTPTCEVALWSKGVPLLAHRYKIYGHSYGPGVLRNSYAFYQGTTPIGQSIGHGGPYDTTAVGTFQVAVDSWSGESSKIFRNPVGLKPVPVTLAKRTVTPLPNVTVADEVACDPSLTPHVIWNMPTLPVLSLAGQPVAFTSGQTVQADTITITHGTASCTLTFAGPTTMIPIGGTDAGGVIHWVDGLDGQPMGGTGHPALWPDLIAKNHIDPSYLKLTDAARQMLAGDWRIQVPLPAGGGELTTTIKVQ